MPELRRGVRRRRATVGQKKSESPATKYVKTRAAVAREVAETKQRPRTRLATKQLKQEKLPVIVISEPDSYSEEPIKADKDKEEVEGVMGDDSGGLSAKKPVGQDDDGNTTPFPERVSFSVFFPFILVRLFLATFMIIYCWVFQNVYSIAAEL